MFIVAGEVAFVEHIPREAAGFTGIVKEVGSIWGVTLEAFHRGISLSTGIKRVLGGHLVEYWKLWRLPCGS